MCKGWEGQPNVALAVSTVLLALLESLPANPPAALVRQLSQALGDVRRLALGLMEAGEGRSREQALALLFAVAVSEGKMTGVLQALRALVDQTQGKPLRCIPLPGERAVTEPPLACFAGPLRGGEPAHGRIDITFSMHPLCKQRRRGPSTTRCVVWGTLCPCCCPPPRRSSATSACGWSPAPLRLAARSPVRTSLRWCQTMCICTYGVPRPMRW
jgi:hypothetical protein